MDVFLTIIKGIFVGAFTYAISFYCFIVFSSYFVNQKLDFGGEWGGNIVIAVIALVIGAIIGGILGMAQSKTKTIVIISSIIAIVFLLMVIPLLYNSYLRYLLEENNYRAFIVEIFTWSGFALLLIFNNWLISKFLNVSDKQNALPL